MMDIDLNTILLIVIIILAVLRWFIFPPKPQVIEKERRVRVRERQNPVDLQNFDHWLSEEIRKRGAYTLSTSWLLTMFRYDEIEVIDDDGYGLLFIQIREPEEPALPVWNNGIPSAQAGFAPIRDYNDLR